MYLYFDIETIPNQSESGLKQIRAEIEEEKAKIAAPGNYKDPEKIAEFVNLKRIELDGQADANWRKTALDGGSGHIAAICWAVNDGEVIGHRLSWPAVNGAGPGTTPASDAAVICGASVTGAGIHVPQA